MKKTVVAVAGATLLACTATIINNRNTEPVVVQVDYGNSKSTKEVALEWEDDLTALEALQKISEVETYPAANNIIVHSIDSVKGNKGSTAWYYFINEKPAKVFAMKTILAEGDTLLWQFKTDTCTETVCTK